MNKISPVILFYVRSPTSDENVKTCEIQSRKKNVSLHMKLISSWNVAHLLTFFFPFQTTNGNTCFRWAYSTNLSSFTY